MVVADNYIANIIDNKNKFRYHANDRVNMLNVHIDSSRGEVEEKPTDAYDIELSRGGMVKRFPSLGSIDGDILEKAWNNVMEVSDYDLPDLHTVKVSTH